MPQTRYVLSKALARGLKPVVVLNKCDREGARIGTVENEVSRRPWGCGEVPGLPGDGRCIAVHCSCDSV
jgi:hypothetical protein